MNPTLWLYNYTLKASVSDRFLRFLYRTSLNKNDCAEQIISELVLINVEQHFIEIKLLEWKKA